jgi:transposase
MSGLSRRRMMDRKIVEMLIHGEGINHIGRSLHVAKRRIRALREKAMEQGYLEADGQRGPVALPDYPKAIFADRVDGRTQRLSESHQVLEGQREWIREHLEAGWHAVTVFEELPVEGVSRSSFYRFLERHQLNRLGENYRVVPEIRHRPGEALLLDWGKLRDVPDSGTGHKRVLWAFVGVLGFSRYLLVRLVWTMDTPTTLGAIESMLRQLGGVPFKITIDNPKCMALEACPYEPLLNPAVERFAAHYGVRIECLPPADPQKKGKVERPMPYCRRLYEAHGEAWQGIEESQAYLDRKLILANQRRHGTTMKRPQDVFVQEEAPALQPLPALAYEIEQFHEGVVRQDGHVRFANKYYSVEEKHKGKSVVVLGGAQQVSIYHQGQLLEVHARITDPYQSKSTKPEHLKPWERAMRDDSMYRKRAAALGPHVDEMVLRLLGRGQGFIDTRRIWGILSLDKRYAAAQINEACRRALELDQLSYRTVKGFLELEAIAALARSGATGPGSAAPPAAPAARAHKHVRPLTVYQEQLRLFTEEDHTYSEGERGRNSTGEEGKATTETKRKQDEH